MTLRFVFVSLLFSQVFRMGFYNTVDPDMWWHLRTGEYIWRQGIPRQDIFSFTVPTHAWITHEWLSEALMWKLYQMGGLFMLATVFALLAALTFFIMYRRSTGQPYLVGAIIVLAAAAAAPSLGVRPQVFSLFLTAVFVSIIEAVRSGSLSTRALFVLPVLAVVWVNLHGGYLLGPAILAAYGLGEVFDVRLASPAERRSQVSKARTFFAVGALCVVAGVANPNGWRLLGYPFETLGSGFMQENISEWRSPDFHGFTHLPFLLLLGAGLTGWALRSDLVCGTDLVLFLATGAAGLTSVRHIAVFAVVAVPIVARSCAGVFGRTRAWELLTRPRESERPSRGRARLNLVILTVGMAVVTLQCALKWADNNRAIARAFPVSAVDFLQRAGLEHAAGFNTYVWGGYLIWRGIKVFVDGRADVYGDEFLTTYLKTYRLSEDWRKPLDDFAVSYVLIERSNTLGTLLAATSAWREAYADDVARVFVRAGGSP